MPALTRMMLQSFIRAALREDAASNDITSRAVIPSTTRIRATVLAKVPGTIAGLQIAAWTFAEQDRALRCRLMARDGQTVRPRQKLLIIEGNARSIFAAERTTLNLLGHLSGIATLTRAFVERTSGTRAKILDTRKTLPGLRVLEKYAVRAGGGCNHRNDLAEAILIKTNHLRAIRPQSISAAIAKARRARARGFVEIEVANLAEFRRALAARPDAILLDNWPLTAIRKAARLRRGRRPILEASGGVTLANVRALAKTGVDRISIGRLTHSAPALDVSLHVV